MILCVANLVPIKGIEVLIHAYKELIIEKPGAYTLLIVGDNNNEYGSKLGSMVKEMRLEGNVIFAGKQQNIPDFHAIADVFVLPTLNEGRREGSPVALLEALACGTISIASNIPGIRDQLCDFRS